MTPVAPEHPTINPRVIVTEETGELAGDRRDDAERFEPPDGPTILRAYCQAQLVDLPRGGRGTRAAIDLLTAIPKCARLGWADMTVSAPELFRMIEHAELLKSRPAASDMTAALRLVASVCALVTQRSARRWSVWFSRACDPAHALGASIREAVTPAMLHRSAGMPPSEDSRPTSSLIAEPDSLVKELESTRDALAVAHDETKRLKNELRSARKTLKTLKRLHAALIDAYSLLRGRRNIGRILWKQGVPLSEADGLLRTDPKGVVDFARRVAKEHRDKLEQDEGIFLPACKIATSESNGSSSK